jgi:alkylation response protein AidB-like acyl-CoA dehydrogenase
MTVVETHLFEVVKEIGPKLQEAGPEAERERRLPKRAIDLLAEAGLQRMFTPQSLGGLEVDPVTCARVIEDVARFDSAAGWALQAGNSGAWWSARLPDEGAQEIYGGNPNVLMAAAFHPPQQAIEVSGGYRVTGRGPLASTVHDAQWLFLSAIVMQGAQPKMVDGAPEVVAVILRTNEVEIIDTWQTLGMRGTDSNDVAMTNVFVPASRTFRLVPEFTPGKHYGGALYRFPGIAEAAVIVAPVLLAIARGALDEFLQLARGKTPFGSTKLLRDRSVVQATIARAEALWRSARVLFYDTLDHAWQQAVAGQAFTLEQKADLLLAGVHATHSAWNIVDLMHRLAGTSAIYTRSRLERHLRDALTLRHHGFVSESKYETVGQVYLGVPPEFGLVAF